MMVSEMNNDKIQEQYRIFKAKQAEPKVEKFTPPFKRLNQTELLECLGHGWTGRATFVKAAVEPPTGSGKYARMAYNTLLRKSAFVSAVVVPNDKQDYHYRMVNYDVVVALEKKGLIVVTFTSDGEAVFSLSGNAGRQLKKEA